MRYKIKSKKAEAIGSTPTWTAATVIIVFILIVLIILSIALFSEKKAIKVKEKGQIVDKIVLTKKIVEFLETPIEDKKIKELIEGNPEENIENFIKFENEAKSFLNKNFDSKIYSTAWIRLYDKNEEPEQFQTGKYVAYEAVTVYSGRGDYCDPRVLREGISNKISSVPEVTFFEFPVEDKKIAVCWEYRK